MAVQLFYSMGKQDCPITCFLILSVCKNGQMLKWLLENLKTGGNEPDGEPDYPLCGDTDGKAMWQEQYKGIDDWELREPEGSYGNMAA